MGINSAIEWTDHSVNFFIGCTKVSPGCAFCYPERNEKRFGRDFSVIRKTNWSNVIATLRRAKPGRVFADSYSDLFHEQISDADLDAIHNIFSEFPQHQFLVLTKRIERAAAYYKYKKLPKNLWIGTSVESQDFVWRIDYLKRIKNARIRFVSFEPLIDEITNVNLAGIELIIVGGESHPRHPRPMQEVWAQQLLGFARLYGCAFFLKQIGGRKKCKCHNSWGCRVMNGRTYDEMPKTELLCERKC